MEDFEGCPGVLWGLATGHAELCGEVCGEEGICQGGT